MRLRSQNLRGTMKWMIFVLFASIIRIESHKLLETRKQIKPKTSEIRNIIDATAKVCDVNEKINQIFADENVRVQASYADEFVQQFQRNVVLLKNTFDRVVYDYVARKLWNYSRMVHGLIKKISETRGFEKKDVDLIKFEETFDYSAVTYLFNSDLTTNYVHYILDAIYYLQILPYVKFSSARKIGSFILEKTAYISNTIKLYGEIDPGDSERNDDHNQCSIEELAGRLLKIRSDISQLSKGFGIATTPPIINKNLVLEPKVLKPTTAFVKSIMHNESVTSTCSEFAKNRKTPECVIESWKVDSITYSLMDQLNAYQASVAGNIATLLVSNDDVTNTKVFKDNLITLLKSLRIRDDYDRYCYCNAVIYQNIAVDILMLVSTQLGYRMLRAISKVINDACTYQLQKKPTKMPLTVDMIYSMRSQLLQFQFYYTKMNETIHQRLRSVLDYGLVYHNSYTAFQKVFPNVLSLMNITSPVEVFLENNCSALVQELIVVIEAEYGTFFDEVKFKEFFLVDTVRYVYEIFDYYTLHINIT